MSDTGTQTDQQLDEGGIAALREAARRGEAATKKAEELERKLLFAEAGIDTAHEVGKMLFDTWDGNEFDKVVATATKFGAMKGATKPPTEGQLTPEQQAAADAQAAEDARRGQLQEQLGQGGAPAPAADNGVHPRDAAREAYHAAVKAGQDPEIARDDAFAKVLAAGHVQHDPRMVFDEAVHKMAAEEADRAAMRGTARSTVG